MSNTDSNGRFFWMGSSALIAAMLLAGWYFSKDSQDLPAAPVAGASCAPIPNGMQFAGGKLVPLDMPKMDIASVETPDVDVEIATPEVEAPSGWAQKVAASFPALGFPWMKLDVSGSEAEVSGKAPSLAVKSSGFEVAKVGIENAAPAGEVTRIINNIDVETGSPTWAGDMKTAFNDIGFPWMDLNVRGRVATISGTAPDAATKTRAFELGQATLQRNPLAASQINLIVDGISVEGGEVSAGAALAELASTSGEQGPDLQGCRTAFVNTMQGRNIEFALGAASLSLESTGLLDALTGIAILCTGTSGYNVEIGGHTDKRGGPNGNQRLSQARADSVRNYLIEKGVDGRRLQAVGYGESRLLDDGDSEAAHAKNRRTEFIVTE